MREAQMWRPTVRCRLDVIVEFTGLVNWMPIGEAPVGTWSGTSRWRRALAHGSHSDSFDDLTGLC